MTRPILHGLIPADLAPRSYRIALENFELPADIGFHDFEVGTPQRIRVTVEIWLDPAHAPAEDAKDHAWDYDFLRHEIRALAGSRRHNLQETLARAIYDLIASRHGVVALKVRTEKPDVYPDAGVSVELASF